MSATKPDPAPPCLQCRSNPARQLAFGPAAPYFCSVQCAAEFGLAYAEHSYRWCGKDGHIHLPTDRNCQRCLKRRRAAYRAAATRRLREANAAGGPPCT